MSRRFREYCCRSARRSPGQPGCQATALQPDAGSAADEQGQHAAGGQH